MPNDANVIKFLDQVIPAYKNNNVEKTRQLTLEFSSFFLKKDGPFVNGYAKQFLNSKLNALKNRTLDLENNDVDRAFLDQYNQAISVLKMKNAGREGFSKGEVLDTLLTGQSIGIVMNAFFDDKLKQKKWNLKQLQEQQKNMVELNDCLTGCCVHEQCQSASDNFELRVATSVLKKLANQMIQVHAELLAPAKLREQTWSYRFATAVGIKEKYEPLTTKHKVIMAGMAVGGVVGGGLLAAAGAGAVIIGGVPVWAAVGGALGLGAVAVAGPTVVKKTAEVATSAVKTVAKAVSSLWSGFKSLFSSNSSPVRQGYQPVSQVEPPKNTGKSPIVKADDVSNVKKLDLPVNQEQVAVAADDASPVPSPRDSRSSSPIDIDFDPRVVIGGTLEQTGSHVIPSIAPEFSPQPMSNPKQAPQTTVTDESLANGLAAFLNGERAPGSPGSKQTLMPGSLPTNCANEVKDSVPGIGNFSSPVIGSPGAK
jgi:hypothetical protein